MTDDWWPPSTRWSNLSAYRRHRPLPTVFSSFFFLKRNMNHIWANSAGVRNKEIWRMDGLVHFPFIPGRHAWFNDKCSSRWLWVNLVREASKAPTTMIQSRQSKCRLWEQKYLLIAGFLHLLDRIAKHRYFGFRQKFSSLCVNLKPFHSFPSRCLIFNPHVNFTLPSRVFAQQAVNASSCW